MRLTTWNVNGIRNPFSYPPWNSARSFPAMFDTLQTDIIVMQELKIQRKDLRDDMVLLDGWDAYFSLPKHKKGYSGVGMFTRNCACAPIRAEEGLLGHLPSVGTGGVLYKDLPKGECIGGYPSSLQLDELGVDDPAELDAEGRCLLLEFTAFVLIGVYCPANSNGLRDDFRHGFIGALDCRVRNLIDAGKRVVLVGDLNVNRDELDGASALDDRRKGSISHEEYISTPNRRIFNQLLIGGEVIGERDEGRPRGVLLDTTRHFHPDRRGMYTHWEQKINARPGNFGSRIDFILISDAMKEWPNDANTQDGLLGSDHCPVYLEFHDKVDFDGRETHLVDIMNPPGTFTNGVRQQEWQLQRAPALSGKKMQEFDKRRSIKNMFAGAGKLKPQSLEIATATRTEPNASIRVDEDEILGASTWPSQSSQRPTNLASDGTTLPSQPLSAVQVSTESPRGVKRKQSTTVTAANKLIKRSKPDGVVPGQVKSTGQQSLRGFFRATGDLDAGGVATKADTAVARIDEASAVPPPGRPDREPNSHDALPPPRRPPFDHEPGPVASDEDPTASPIPSTASIYDASPTNIEAREATHHSWNALFSRPVAPLCESHDEPCKTMQTKKKGSNQGRSFWMCARPLGPSGQKESGSEWRCGTFIWCSDWGGGRR